MNHETNPQSLPVISPEALALTKMNWNRNPVRWLATHNASRGARNRKGASVHFKRNF